MTNCNGCGAVLPENAKFCLECGAKREAQVALSERAESAAEAVGRGEVLVCGKCGEAVEVGKKFCLACGANLGESGVLKPAAEVAERGGVLVCGKCGEAAEEGKKFCLACGANLSESGVLKPAAEAAGHGEVLVCGKCGEAAEEGKKFCLACGANLSESGVLKPAAEVAEDVVEAAEGDPPPPAMISVTSKINHWSYEVPDFFDAMGLPFNDYEDQSHQGSADGAFANGVMRGEFGRGLNSLDDYFQSAYDGGSVFVKEMTEINGLPALYCQHLSGDFYTHAAIVAYKQESWGFVYDVGITVPRTKMDAYRDAMDAFVFSFKLDEEKIQKKFGERGAARLHAEVVWQKNRAARKNPEAANPDCFFFDGSLIRATGAVTKTELFIDNTLVAQFKSLWGYVDEKTPLLKAENYKFKSGLATIEVYFTEGILNGDYTVAVNMNGEIYPLGKCTVKQLSGKRILEAIDYPGRLTNLPMQSESESAQPAPAPQPAASQARACTSCGKELKPAAKFCPACGASQ